MHGGRTAFFVKGEGVVVEPPAAAGGATAAAPVQSSLLKFGRLLDRRPELKGDEDEAMVRKLTELGECMNDPKTCGQQPVQMPDDDSDIPAGYTYLGQFIAHEITFDNTNETLKPGIDPINLRTPQIDLDSLYGGPNGPRDRRYSKLYEPDGVRLRVGKTSHVTPPNDEFCYDLPRDADCKENPKKAIIADPRNDENLPVAQTHVAFIRFHNRVVERLKVDGHYDDDLFECARGQVVRHFQWIIIHDYLPKLVDENVRQSVLGGTYKLFKLDEPGGPTMPLEFSAAAFRIGHTMVRAAYNWNIYHDEARMFGDGPASVLKLFELTGFRSPRGDQFDPSVDGFSTNSTKPEGVKALLTLPSDWAIDWRRFYKFPQAGGAPQPRVNKASKLDTVLNFRLDKLEGFPDAKTGKAQEVIKAITVRNLLRGYFLGLPTGEEVAKKLELGEDALKPEQVAEGAHKALLSDPLLFGKTPLWYYILKEAELLGKGPDGTGGHRLGPVGSRIVAETLVGLIRQSPYSILDAPGWRPRFGRPAQGGEPALFEMTDLLKFAFGDAERGENSVNPVGL
jgi:hypothetical protein